MKDSKSDSDSLSNFRWNTFWYTIRLNLSVNEIRFGEGLFERALDVFPLIAVRDTARGILSWVSSTDRSTYYSMSVDGHTLYRLNYPLRLNRWYHSCQSWNGRTGEWQVWINSERVGRGFHNLVRHPQLSWSADQDRSLCVCFPKANFSDGKLSCVTSPHRALLQSSIFIDPFL